ncbi:MAG: Sir2 silent information regulator family NAD-dependent deacetylase [Oscillospiraceae bacterium]|nr:Sir2 silent information regulator family NAD-dependent deacetylase [Oscillospiraceae bacterium]
MVIGAGEGLSASAGFTCAGERFAHWFRDFGEKYGFSDMCTGGFYPFPDAGEYWAYWSRYIMANRYMNPPKPVYNTLLELVRDKDYFVLTTNVDHCFQKAGFDKKRLFYTQGDYGLFQCSEPCRQETWDNERVIRDMFEKQRNMRVPPELIPCCPHCGKPVALNLRADETFVEDDGWHAAAQRYSDFLHSHEGRSILFLELGVRYNTPVIIKYPFWGMTYKNPSAFYACVNAGETMVPDNIAGRSVCIDGDIGEALDMLREAL